MPTLKEAPAEAELASHRLMLRAGMIRRLGSGLYSWLPLGLRVLRKVETIVRQEMNAAGAIEVLMPAVQPAELWQESGRWDEFGPQMLKIKDRHQRDFCFGPTHEEVITDIMRREIKSYRQLPVNLYQIQIKFRDEIRPRFGVMRAREFVMKDAYSFDADKAGLDQSYRRMYDAYERIFKRLGLKYRAVAADPGAIGGTGSHEFHVLAESGEDAIAFCPQSGYAANIELAEAVAPAPVAAPTDARGKEKVPTPGVRTIADLCARLAVPPEQTIKTLVYEGTAGLVALLLRGDHVLNEIKASKLAMIKVPLQAATEPEVRDAFGAGFGSLGPVLASVSGPSITIVADRAVAAMPTFVCGANEDGYHLTGVNLARDVPSALIADIRNVVAGDPSPDGRGALEICRGVEVGHVFQLGTKYSAAMNATFLDAAGETQLLEMGCYGIGVSRIVAAAIEQNFDDRGIVWPAPLAPFDVAIVPIGLKKSAVVREAVEELYAGLGATGIEVLLDDRDERPGVMFADTELIGIPHRVVVGERGLKQSQIEYQRRGEGAAEQIRLGGALEILRSRICGD